MPIDARHGKNIPRGTALAAVLRPLLRREYRRVRRRLLHGNQALLSSEFRAELFQLLAPVLADYYENGRRMAQRRMLALATVGKRFREEPLVVKAPRFPQVGYAVEFGTNETVELAANRLALDLAGGITETLRDRMRDTLGSGLAEGFSPSEIADAFEPHFGRKRAETIAVTEASRAQHAGEVDHYRSMGIKRHQWMASADACDVCMGLDGVTLAMGSAFFTHDGGKAAYRVVEHPPLHPLCKCTVVPVFDEGDF